MLPIYDVRELSMEEALLVLAAEKESLGNVENSRAVPLSVGIRKDATGVACDFRRVVPG
ncbi:MAG: hypothetical protein OQL28_12055 [Sedimenticola sp.]|nr:hypothetical protein [Sedimenticola sp.]